MHPLDLVHLPAMMERTSGRPAIAIGTLDGPVAPTHPDLAGARLRPVSGALPAARTHPTSPACVHGTFVAGILAARRGTAAPALCPDCTLLVRPIVPETAASPASLPSATPEELAAAILAGLDASVWVVNLSLAHLSTSGARALTAALDATAQRGVLVVAAAGSQGTLGSSNLGHAIGRRGSQAPGEAVTSLGAAGQPLTLAGTSVAAPFVTVAIALLWSLFPTATAAELKVAIGQLHRPRRTVVPPLVDAWAAYQALAQTYGKGAVA